MNNIFYISKFGEKYTYFLAKCEWVNGSIVDAADNVGCLDRISVTNVSRLMFSLIKYNRVQYCIFTFYDSNEVMLSESKILYSSDTSKNQDSREYEINVPTSASYITVNVYLNNNATDIDYMRVDYQLMISVVPHYKSLKLKTEKKNEQMFFRNSLDGKITLHGNDYKIIADASIETKFKLYLYNNEDRIYEASFSKTDCKLNHERFSIELGLTTSDTYNKILDAYDKTYDLLKLPIEKTKIELSKRGIIQVYILGEKTITNYCAGTVHEYEVMTPVDNLEELQNKYYFGEPTTFKEISLSGFNYDINASAVLTAGSSMVNALSGNQQFSIVFEKVASKNEIVDGTVSYYPALCLSDDKTKAYSVDNNWNVTYLYDIYSIRIYTSIKGKGYCIYSSEKTYGNDNNFILAHGSNMYKMRSLEQPAPMQIPTPQEFYLSNSIITHNVCMRILSGAETSVDGNTKLYDLPSDDFAVEKTNYKYCIGLNFNNLGGSRIATIRISADTQKEPTQFGLTEFGEYFMQPQYLVGGLGSRLYPFPLAKSSWGNASLWIGFEEYVNPVTGEPEGAESLVGNYTKNFYHKDAMEIGSIIKTMLLEIDKSIKFESTEEYSQFLYGNVNIGTSKYNQKIMLTQKSNVLKGEYDQAAQRVEITFKQLMETLRDCFRCYWFIDDQNRFRLEHIYFFMNGLSYGENNNQIINLINERDKFNIKPVLYDQKKVSYKKSELSARYEFMWADGTISEAMGGGFNININSNYVQQDKVESINIQNISSDISMMMYKPDEFSMDGFVLMSVNSENKVPLKRVEYYMPNNNYPVVTFVQNLYMSFLYLFENYLYDMPATGVVSSIDNNNYSRYSVKNIKKSMEHDIEVPLGIIPSPYSIIQTELGNGTIESIKTDVDTLLSEVSLSYEPK